MPTAAQSTPRVLYEQDFVANPALTAQSPDVVLFDLEPLAHGRTPSTQFARYDLDAGKHTICMDADDLFLTEVVLEDADGKKLLRLHRPHGGSDKGDGRRKPRQPECAEVSLAANTYTLRVTHDGRAITGAHRVAFVQPMSSSLRLTDDAGAPLGGYWALRPDSSIDPRRRLGRVIAPPPDRSVTGTPFTAIRPLVADFYLGGYRFQFGVTRQDRKLANFFLRATPFFATTLSLNYDQGQPDPAPPASIDVLFRFYPDGTQIGALQEGEVALFQQCNYQRTRRACRSSRSFRSLFPRAGARSANFLAWTCPVSISPELT